MLDCYLSQVSTHWVVLYEMQFYRQMKAIYYSYNSLWLISSIWNATFFNCSFFAGSVLAFNVQPYLPCIGYSLLIPLSSYKILLFQRSLYIFYEFMFVHAYQCLSIQILWFHSHKNPAQTPSAQHFTGAQLRRVHSARNLVIFILTIKSPNSSQNFGRGISY